VGIILGIKGIGMLLGSLALMPLIDRMNLI